MNDKYEVIKEFECHGNRMVTVRIGNAAHVMTLEEWHKIYGRNHQEKWETRLIGIGLYQESNIKRNMFLKSGGMT